MEKLNIVCVDDQRDILDAICKDLNTLESHCTLHQCESAAEAEQLFNELEHKAAHIALIICDHMMPGKSGIDFLINLTDERRFFTIRKLLVTGMATHEDTIHAINRAHIDRYIAKPWNPEELLNSAKVLLTLYILHTGLDYEDYLPLLDHTTLYRKLNWEG